MEAMAEEGLGDAEEGKRRPPEGEETESNGGGGSSEAAHDALEEGGPPGKSSCVSDCSVEIRLDNGVQEVKISIPKVEKDCRICHLGLMGGAPESGILVELGCSCKNDLAAAHRQCAEAWFKIRGSRTCEICGSLANNVTGTCETEFMEQWSEARDVMAAATITENPSGHSLLTVILTCLVFVFVASWLFHFSVPS